MYTNSPKSSASLTSGDIKFTLFYIFSIPPLAYMTNCHVILPDMIWVLKYKEFIFVLCLNLKFIGIP